MSETVSTQKIAPLSSINKSAPIEIPSARFRRRPIDPQEMEYIQVGHLHILKHFSRRECEIYPVMLIKYKLWSVLMIQNFILCREADRNRKWFDSVLDRSML